MVHPFFHLCKMCRNCKIAILKLLSFFFPVIVTLHTYTGLTCNTFKERWDKHNFTFTHEDAEHTTLSSFIHELKERGTNYSMKWEIVEKARPFNPISGICALCTREKFLIIFSPQGASLNKRSELFSTCRHKKRLLLVKPKKRNPG